MPDRRGTLSKLFTPASPEAFLSLTRLMRSKEKNESAFADEIQRAVNVDPQSELSPIDSNKRPNEQCVETGR